MLELKTLDDLRGNNVIIYTIKNLLSTGAFPKFVILSGHMGVGKSSVARLIAERINGSNHKTVTYNFGMQLDMNDLESTVFKMNPATPRAFIFEEIHGMDKSQQTALLTMLDTQPFNVYVICTTTEIQRILPTIKSRGTLLQFRLLGTRQLSQLLDDYLESKFTSLPKAAKQSLLRASRGIPRDLLKNTDLVLSSNLSTEQLNELLGNVSEDLIFSLICSLKSDSADFAENLTSLLEDPSSEKLNQMRDFYTSVLLDMKSHEYSNVPKDKIETLTGLFSPAELEEIGKTLVRAKVETLPLELSLLNMRLTRTTSSALLGKQIDKYTSKNAEGVQKNINDAIKRTPTNTANLRSMKLGGE